MTPKNERWSFPKDEQALAHYDDVMGTCIEYVSSLILEFDNVISMKVEQQSVICGR
jgi:hypothetical protein